MASSGVLRYNEATAAFAVLPEVRPAMQATRRLLAACDVSAVTSGLDQLLHLCRQGDGTTPADTCWSALCSLRTSASSSAPLGTDTMGQSAALFATESPTAFWGSLDRRAQAMKLLHLIGLGAMLGYWHPLCEGPMTSSALARRTSCSAVHTKEWCTAMADGGLLEIDARGGGTSFAVVARLCTVFRQTERLIASCDLSPLQRHSRLRDVYQHGGGIMWGEFGACAGSCACSDSTSTTYRAALIPSLPKQVTTKLHAGGAIADVGCGQGGAACLLGEAFPRARVHGCDYHAPSIAAAVELAHGKGLQNVSFETRPSDDFASDAAFDLVCFLDCFHDMAVAISAAKHVHRVLKPDGAVFLVEPMAAARDSVLDQLSVPTASYLSAISCHVCLPCGSCDEGDGLGTMCPTETLRHIFVEKAGFAYLEAVECQLNLVGFRLLIAGKTGAPPQTTARSVPNWKQLSFETVPPMCTSPLKPTPRMSVSGEARLGGVSSFGYAGTIAHMAMSHVPNRHWAPQQMHLVHRRRAYPWWDQTEQVGVKRRTHAYAACWALVPHQMDAVLTAPWLFFSIHSTASTALLTQPAPCTLVHALGVLLNGTALAAPSLRGARLALALIQQYAANVNAPLRVLVITSGVLAMTGTNSTSDAAHGGAWGFTRVVRLEHPVLLTQSADVMSNASLALTAPMSEAEVAWYRTGCLTARLRACKAPTAYKQKLMGGLYAITGGLGGLGVRATMLLIEDGASATLLASRSGRVARDGQGLEVQLRSKSAIVAVVASDSADPRDAGALLSLSLPTGVLHTAGVGDKGLLVDLKAWQLQWMHASKAAGAWHLQCARALLPLDARLLFSSVGSGLGNVGQASYATANAYLDTHASSQRVRGVMACSIQWPLVGGAGMGAAAFAAVGERQVAIVGLAGISLEEYAMWLGLQLAGNASPALSVQMVHQSDARMLLQDVADASQSRFGELAVLGQHAEHGGVEPATLNASSSLSSSLTQLVALGKPSQHRTHIEASVLRAVRELTGAPFAALAAETPLMEAGIDSLAATELASQMRAISGVALSPTLVFEQPTPRAIAWHIVEQLICVVGTRANLSSDQVCASVPPLGRTSVIDQCSRGGDCDAARSTLPAACGNPLSGVRQAWWVLEKAMDKRMLSAQALCVHHGCFDACSFGLPQTEVGDGVTSFTCNFTLLHTVIDFGIGDGRKLRGYGSVAGSSQASAFSSQVAEADSGGFGGRPRVSVGFCHVAFKWGQPASCFAQRSLPSSDGRVAFRLPAADALYALAADHIVQGRVVFPGAGYLEMARAAVESTGLHRVYFLQPLAVEVSCLVVECTVSFDAFEVRSSDSDDVQAATVHCSGAIAGVSRMQYYDRAWLRATSRATEVKALYDGFYAVGLHYGPGYRTLVQAWVGANHASARLRVRSTQQGTQVHPSDLDDALCASGAMVSSGDGKTRLPFAVDDALLQGALGELWAVRICTPPPPLTVVADHTC